MKRNNLAPHFRRRGRLFGQVSAGPVCRASDSFHSLHQKSNPHTHTHSLSLSTTRSPPSPQPTTTTTTPSTTTTSITTTTPRRLRQRVGHSRRGKYKKLHSLQYLLNPRPSEALTTFRRSPLLWWDYSSKKKFRVYLIRYAEIN